MKGQKGSRGGQLTIAKAFRATVVLPCLEAWWDPQYILAAPVSCREVIL